MNRIKKSDEKSLSSPIIMVNNQEVTLFDFKNKVDWPELESRLEEFKEDNDLSTRQFRTYISLLVLGVNFENSNLNKTFNMFKNFETDVVGRHYFVFASWVKSVNEITLPKLKNIKKYVVQNNLIDDFNINKRLFHLTDDRPREVNEIMNTTRYEAIM